MTFASTSLAAGTYTNTVRVTTGSTQLDVPVTTRVYSAGASTPPTGSFDTPVNGMTNVAGAIPVTGWAVDDVAVARIDIYRDPVAGESGIVLLGNASIIAGSRPDVENLYPNAPMNYRTGWGFMVLTNMLPGSDERAAEWWQRRVQAACLRHRRGSTGRLPRRQDHVGQQHRRAESPSARLIRRRRAARYQVRPTTCSGGRCRREARFRPTGRR